MRILGAGVSGSYLTCLLQDHYKFKVHDPLVKRGCTCAFGCFYSHLKEKLKKVGLNVEDYILCKNHSLVVNGITFELKNQISLDKPRMIEDLLPRKNVVRSRKNALFGCCDEDLVINATGIPFFSHYLIPTLQYKVCLEGLEPKTNYIYLDSKHVGYAWAFSLDDEGKYFHMGAGCVNRDPRELVHLLHKFYKFSIVKALCGCRRPIRITDPEFTGLAFLNLIAIGEAAGFCYPLTGEGIIPAMDSAELLASVMDHATMNSLKDDIVINIVVGYRKLARRYLREHDYHKAFKVWKLMEKHPCTAWLMGFRFLYKRTKTRAQPVMSKKKLVQLFSTLLRTKRGRKYEQIY